MQAHDRVAQKGQEVQVDACKQSYFPGVEEATSDCSDIGDDGYGDAILYLL
jgi:hypothetical protein